MSLHLFCLARGVCRRVLQRENILEVFQRIYLKLNFNLFQRLSTVFLKIISSGQKRGPCGHVMALFDGHMKCARCRDKGVGDDPGLKKDCPICNSFTPEQAQ